MGDEGVRCGLGRVDRYLRVIPRAGHIVTLPRAPTAATFGRHPDRRRLLRIRRLRKLLFHGRVLKDLVRGFWLA